MSRLANCNKTAKVVRALRRAGFTQREGGRHTVMQHPNGRFTTVPRHPLINTRTLRLIVKQCGLTEDEFIALY